MISLNVDPGSRDGQRDLSDPLKFIRADGSTIQLEGRKEPFSWNDMTLEERSIFASNPNDLPEKYFPDGGLCYSVYKSFPALKDVFMSYDDRDRQFSDLVDQAERLDSWGVTTIENHLAGLSLIDLMVLQNHSLLRDSEINLFELVRNLHDECGGNSDAESYKMMVNEKLKSQLQRGNLNYQALIDGPIEGINTELRLRFMEQLPRVLADKEIPNMGKLLFLTLAEKMVVDTTGDDIPMVSEPKAPVEYKRTLLKDFVN